MAISIVTIRLWVLALALTYVSVLYSYLGKADEAVPQTGGEGYDPVQIVSNALLCFNDKYIYSSCEESYRLSQSGNLNVPPQNTDEYCTGPCLTETNLVLKCIDNIFANFEFYNKATIEDVGDTIKEACGNGPERGNFDVSQHIQAEESNGHKAINQILYGLAFMIVGHGLLP
ncbi:Glycine-rich family protein, putative isoform 1 [Fagus crenata]